MNLGENLSEDIFFSGTVGGAFSGYLYGIPSLAVSLIAGLGQYQQQEFEFAQGAEITAKVLEKLLAYAHDGVIYNLNIPFPNRGEIAVTTLGNKRYTPDIIERTDPRGRKYYWIGTGTPNYSRQRRQRYLGRAERVYFPERHQVRFEFPGGIGLAWPQAFQRIPAVDLRQRIRRCYPASIFLASC